MLHGCFCMCVKSVQFSHSCYVHISLVSLKTSFTYICNVLLEPQALKMKKNKNIKTNMEDCFRNCESAMHVMKLISNRHSRTARTIAALVLLICRYVCFRLFSVNVAFSIAIDKGCLCPLT